MLRNYLLISSGSLCEDLRRHITYMEIFIFLSQLIYCVGLSLKNLKDQTVLKIVLNEAFFKVKMENRDKLRIFYNGGYD